MPGKHMVLQKLKTECYEKVFTYMILLNKGNQQTKLYHHKFMNNKMKSFKQMHHPMRFNELKQIIQSDSRIDDYE